MGFLIALPAPSALAESEGLKPITRAQPEYPRAALRRGVEGSVVLEFSVDRHGNVVQPRIVESTPPGVFDRAALRALSQWKYRATGADATTPLKVRVTFRKS